VTVTDFCFTGLLHHSIDSKGHTDPVIREINPISRVIGFISELLNPAKLAIQ
jgi:hypothetical protein